MSLKNQSWYSVWGHVNAISCGATIAFAMDCFERGSLGLKDTDGLESRWRNTDAIVRMVDKISQRQGFGDVLVEGGRRAAAGSVPSLELTPKDY